MGARATLVQLLKENPDRPLSRPRRPQEARSARTANHAGQVVNGWERGAWSDQVNVTFNVTSTCCSRSRWT